MFTQIYEFFQYKHGYPLSLYFAAVEVVKRYSVLSYKKKILTKQ